MTDADFDADGVDLNRRNFLKAVGAGVSLSAIDLLDEDEAQVGDITFDPEEEVPYIARYKSVRDDEGHVVDREPQYDTLDIDEWVRHRTSEDAMEQVRSQLQDELEPEAAVSVACLEEEESPTDFGVEVRVPPQAKYDIKEIKELLPSTLSGTAGKGEYSIENIPVEVTEVETDLAADYLPECSTYVGELYDDVPGGAPVKVPESSKSYGTAAGAFDHPDYGIGWIISGHVAEDAANDVDQMGGSNGVQSMGITRDVNLDRDHNAVDYAFVQNTASSESEPIFSIASATYDDNNDRNQAGIVTETELRNNKGNQNYILWTQGYKTCRHDCYILGFEKHFYDDVHAVLTNEAVRDGDSGGPLFHIDGNDAYIAGVIKGSYNDGEDGDTTKDDGKLSTAAETIEERTGGSF